MDGDEKITFLYKLTEGVCPKSYGFNVAGLAGLPRDVVIVARKKAGTYEKESSRIRLLRSAYISCSDALRFVYNIYHMYLF